MSILTSRNKILVGLGVAAIAGAAIYWYFNPGYCRSAKSKYGFEVKTCPDGDVRTVVGVSVNGLQRGGEGYVTVSLEAVYTTDKADSERSAPITKFDAELSMIDDTGKQQALEPVKKKGRSTWEKDGNRRTAVVSLPAVRDGDYILRAKVKSKAGDDSVDMKLPLYAPAKIHVLTDRPLYEAGNTVQFRALVLRAADLSPIDHRPGKWVVRDPGGTALLEEDVKGGDWGVIAGSFPLDSEAATGTWSVAWETGADSATASFDVQPFTLPRFSVEASSSEPFYGAGATPKVSGAVNYSSGAPVSNAAIEIRWRTSGAWPPPPAWLDALPKTATTSPGGSFDLTLPAIPDDLLGKVTLTGILTATDKAGDRISGAASVLLSSDSIAVSALTEMGDGLVRGANNRVYMRVTTADGRPLPGTKIRVRRAWQADDIGIEADLDADSVARVQLDPGPPVNVVVPPMPVRPNIRDRGALVVRTGARDMVADDDASLADRVVMDKWIKPLASCARWVDGDSAFAQIALRVSPAGQIISAVPASNELSACAARIIAGNRLPAGQARVYSLAFRFNDPDMPSLAAEVTSSFGGASDVEPLFSAAALDARKCIPGKLADDLPEALAWQIRAGDKAVSAQWIRVSKSGAVPPAMKACVLAAVNRQKLDEPAEQNDLGLVRLSVDRPESETVVAPQPTIMKGYELRISADLGDDTIGETVLRMKPSAIPTLRLRPEPVLPRPGNTVEVTFLRGPDFKGKLPEKMAVKHLTKTETVDIDQKKRVSSYKLPDDAAGWYEFRAAGALARVFVRPSTELAVAVSPDKPNYRPGERAVINVETRAGNGPTQAAVGLFGVDQSLAQLRPLTGPEALSGLRPKIEMSAPAFSVLEAQALALGRIRGANAAEATVIKVSQVPEPAEVDALVSGSARSEFDPIAELTDRFYPILTELHAQVRAWEDAAPEGEEMTPKKMAAMWSKALDAVEKAGGNIDDAFGRRLRLHRLPSDLLALTEPRQVVVVGTRLPEDVENWSDWVARRKP